MIVFLVVVCVLAGVGFFFGGKWAVRWIKLQRKEARWFREMDEERKKRGAWWEGVKSITWKQEKEEKDDK